MKQKLVITGASGFLGYHLLRAAAPDWEVYAFSHQHPVAFPYATAIRCDLTNYLDLGNALEDIAPDALIHLAAVSDANYCQQHPQQAYAVNVEATRNLAGLCSDYRIPLLFTSTDLVFDGQQGNYTETDRPNPLSRYGEQKAIAEQEVLQLYPEALVARLPLMFGHPKASSGNYLQQLLAQLNRGESPRLFTDEYRSVAGALSISQGLLHLLPAVTGLIHVAGPDRLSRYEFGLRAVRAFGGRAAQLIPCLQKDVKMAAPRPPDVSLAISKALALGYSPLSADEELALIAANRYCS